MAISMITLLQSGEGLLLHDCVDASLLPHRGEIFQDLKRPRAVVHFPLRVIC